MPDRETTLRAMNTPMNTTWAAMITVLARETEVMPTMFSTVTSAIAARMNTQEGTAGKASPR